MTLQNQINLMFISIIIINCILLFIFYQIILLIWCFSLYTYNETPFLFTIIYKTYDILKKIIINIYRLIILILYPESNHHECVGKSKIKKEKEDLKQKENKKFSLDFLLKVYNIDKEEEIRKCKEKILDEESEKNKGKVSNPTSNLLSGMGYSATVFSGYKLGHLAEIYGFIPKTKMGGGMLGGGIMGTTSMGFLISGQISDTIAKQIETDKTKENEIRLHLHDILMCRLYEEILRKNKEDEMRNETISIMQQQLEKISNSEKNKQLAQERFEREIYRILLENSMHEINPNKETEENIKKMEEDNKRSQL